MYEDIGIKEVAINNIVMDIECCENNIKQILNQMINIYDKMSKCTNYTGSQSYSSKANVIKQNINTIINNLENYKYDLLSVKKKFKNTTITVAEELTSRANRINVGTEYSRKK